MIMPFSADSAYQTVKRGMSMVRAIKAGQILYAYTSSTGAVIDATTAAVASIATPGADSYLATPLRSVDVVVSGSIDGASFKAANGASATNQERDNLRKIGLFVL